MFDDPERYEHDGFYEENTDYEDEYETDDSDYIVDDEDTDTEETELSEQAMCQIAKSNENCGQKPLHDWRIPPEHNGSLKM